MARPLALIVEDDQDSAIVFAKALEQAGYQSLIASNGHEAQSRLVFTNPDLVLLDLNLPFISGEVILRQMRGQNRLKKVPVMLVTGDSQVAQDARAEADFVLVKPISFDQLRDIASRLLRVEAAVF